MKQFTVIALAALTLISCTEGPESVAEKFTECLAKGEIEEAKKYATEPTGKLLDLASSFGGAPINPNFEFNSTGDSIVGNEAWVKYTELEEIKYSDDGYPILETGEDSLAHMEGGLVKKAKEIKLVKINGKWLVHIESKK